LADETAYIANVGDSRAIMSEEGGKICTDLSNDHKPDLEKERIEAAGGKVY
jgi:protein phosphatase 2C family protein 2/3